jgi:Tfp pilus assembly protein PilE
MKTNKIKGLTLIEALIWFAIFAAVVAGVFALYANTKEMNNSANVSKEITTTFAKVENVYATNVTTGLTNTIGLQLGVFPNTIKVIDSAAGTLNNVYGGKILLQADPPTGFNLTYEKVPKGPECASIIKSQKNVGWNSLNGSVLLFDESFSVAGVTSICGQKGTGNTQLTFEKWNKS